MNLDTAVHRMVSDMNSDTDSDIVTISDEDTNNRSYQPLAADASADVGDSLN